MQLKYSDIDVDCISYKDEVGDRVLYPNDVETGKLYMITTIHTDDELCNVRYNLKSPEDDSELNDILFEDCLHVESRIAQSKHCVRVYDILVDGAITEAREFLEKYPE